MVETTKNELRQYLRWVLALQHSMEVALHAEDRANAWKYGGYKQFARKYTQIVSAIGAQVTLPPILDFYDVQKIPGGGDTVAFQQKEIVEGVYANVAILRSHLEDEIGVVEDETMALRDFFQARLRSAIFRRPETEREVQDAIEQLFIGRGLQKGQGYDREVGRVKISAKEAVPDFVVHTLSLALEVKIIKSLARVREVVDEINADIAAYAKRYRSLIFIVYDLGYIRDEVEFRHDLERSAVTFVIVVKH